jgi:O-Antigen ligase
MRIFNLPINHFKLYYLGLILVAICLPTSKFALSISMLFLLSNWILEFKFKEKWTRFKNNKSILIFTGIFIVHLLWLLNTKNFGYAFHDIGNKAILLVFPVIIGTSEKLNIKQIKTVLFWFSLAVVSSSIISTSILTGIINYPIHDIRDISAFMSHIRLSLLINFSIFSLAYILFSKEFSMKKSEIIIYIIMVIWLSVFLFLLKSFTGIIVFLLLVLIVLGYYSFKIKDIVPKLFLQVGLITIFLLSASYLTHSISKFYSIKKVDIDKLETHTLLGNKYSNTFEQGQIENGNYVWIYFCQNELVKEWNSRSSIKYNEKDQQGHVLKNTLIRYLTSKGYRKDSVGVSKLNELDVQNIEAGNSNYIFANKYKLYPKIYEAIWEIDAYKKGFNNYGSSITQRFEFLKTASEIIKDHFWFGVGTGDVQDSFNKYYEKGNSPLPIKYWLRAHNQFVTFLLTFGIIGFMIVLLSVFYPAFNSNQHNKYFIIILLAIILLSFLNEDTLETQIGVTFFSYFYSLFLFGYKKEIKIKEE